MDDTPSINGGEQAKDLLIPAWPGVKDSGEATSMMFI